jgi:hypothetical protein
MKKNKMMRTASALLVLVLLTVSIICGTFAKYTTSGNTSDIARVAKWGVTLSATGSLFEKEYSKTENENTTILVKTNSDDAVVAPGTSNSSGVSFSVSGKPEVRTKVSLEVTSKDVYLKTGIYYFMKEVTVDSDDQYNSLGELYALDGNVYKKATGNNKTGTFYQLVEKYNVESEYKPIKFSDGTNEGKSATDIAQILAGKLGEPSVKDGSNGTKVYSSSKSYDENKPISDDLSSYNVTWKWDFDDSAKNGTNDASDTALGNLINMQDNCGYVIAYSNDNGTTLNKITKVDESGKLTYGTSNTEIGCTKVEFDVVIKATQVD